MIPLGMIVQCPYYHWHNSKGVHCEAGRTDFMKSEKKPTASALKKSHTLLMGYMNTYCAATGNYKSCTLAKVLEKSYEGETK